MTNRSSSGKGHSGWAFPKLLLLVLKDNLREVVLLVLDASCGACCLPASKNQYSGQKTVHISQLATIRCMVPVPDRSVLLSEASLLPQVD